MILKSGELERMVRAEAHRELRQSKSRWKEYKRHRSQIWRKKLNESVANPLWFLIGSGLIIANGGRPVLIETLAALYATATAINRGNALSTNLRQGGEAMVFMALPVSEPDIFKFRCRKFARSWIWAFLLFGLAYGTQAIDAGYGSHGVEVALLFATLQTMCGLTIALWLQNTKLNLRLGSVVLILYLSIALAFYGPPNVLGAIWNATMLLPGGWISHAYAAAMARHYRPAALWVAPTVAITATLGIAYRSFRTRMIAEMQVPLLDRLNGVILPAEDEADDDLQRLTEAEPAPLGFIATRKPLDWGSLGPLDRTVGAWYTQRERDICEFMRGGIPPTWQREWGKGAAVAIAVIAGSAVMLLPNWVLFVGLAISAILSAGLLGGTWKGFDQAATAGQFTVAHAVFPMTYREISSVLLKANFIRFVAWAPFGFVAIVAIAVRNGISAKTGATFAIEGLLVALILQPSVVAGRFSPGTDDSKRGGLLALALVLTILMILGILFGVFALFGVTSMLAKAEILVGMTAASSLCWLGYGALINHGKIDFVTNPKMR